jgi:DNA repair exonuclease SbcCD ATPase subunit
MTVIFNRIRYKNFLSTGDQFTDIQLDKHPTTLIVGKNGHGKSTLLDALTFALFGKAFRSINKPLLINSVNLKECLVEIEFQIGKNSYLVRRGMKPNVFEIFENDKLIDQDAKNLDYQAYFEKNILKMTYRSFTQIVTLGSASFTPFMQLKAADRRHIIENLLDIEIFSKMNSVLKNRINDLKEQMSNVAKQIEIAKEKTRLRRQYIEEIKRNIKDEIKTKNANILENQQLTNQLISDIDQIKMDLSDLESKYSVITTINSKLKKSESLLSQANTSIKKINEEIKFFDTNENCPTCKQDINEHHKHSIITSKQEKLDKAIEVVSSIQESIKGYNTEIQALELIHADIRKFTDGLSKKTTEMKILQSLTAKLNKEITDLQNRKSVQKTDEDGLQELIDAQNILEETKGKLAQDRQYYDIIALMLKDTGIKTKVVKQYLPIINRSVNKYLASLDFFVNFTLDENFNEVIKSRGLDEFSYASFSEGEKLRIDLSLLFTWRDIAKMKNSASTNLLIMDEILDSSLDVAGTEDFLKLISQMEENVNIFIISHKGESLQDKFSNCLRFTKVKNFSVLSQD